MAPPAPPSSFSLREEGLSRQAKIQIISQSLFDADPERRLAAIRSMGGSRDPWLNRLLLYKTVDEDKQVAHQAEAALRERGADLIGLCLAETHGPHVTCAPPRCASWATSST